MSVFRIFIEKIKCLKCQKVPENENILAVKNYGFCDNCFNLYSYKLVNITPNMVDRCPITGLPAYCNKTQCAGGNCNFAKAKTEGILQ